MTGMHLAEIFFMVPTKRSMGWGMKMEIKKEGLKSGRRDPKEEEIEDGWVEA